MTPNSELEWSEYARPYDYTVDKPTEKTALVINAYSYRNAGDAAIMLSTAALVRDLGFHEVKISSRYTEDKLKYAESDITLVAPLVDFPSRDSVSNVLRLARFALSAAWIVGLLTFLSRGVLRRNALVVRTVSVMAPSLKVAVAANLVVIGGGGYLYSSRRGINLSLVHSCLSIWIGKKTVPVVMMMPASIGPVERRFDRWLIERALKGVAVVVREEHSLEASSFPPRIPTPAVCPDIAFYGLVNSQEMTDNSDGPVRIVALDWRWSRSAESSAYSHYIDVLAQTVDRLQALGHEVILGGHSIIPEHDQDDLVACEAVAARCANPVTIDRNCDVIHLWAEYSRSSLVIGSRLHASIMALSVGTPALVLG